MGKRVERTRNGGRWTEARFQSFIKSLLRKGSTRWGPANDALKAASVGKKFDERTGRQIEHFKCAGCKEEFPRRDCAKDHIDPVVPIEGWSSWDEIIERMFIEIEGFQVLCKSCHHDKTNEEKEARKNARRERE